MSNKQINCWIGDDALKGIERRAKLNDMKLQHTAT